MAECVVAMSRLSTARRGLETPDKQTSTKRSFPDCWSASAVGACGSAGGRGSANHFNSSAVDNVAGHFHVKDLAA